MLKNREIVQDQTLDTNWTANITRVKLDGASLSTLFPNYKSYRDKTSRSFTFRYQDHTFTVFDWESTNRYDYSLPSVDVFWSNEVEVCVGYKKESAHLVKDFISDLNYTLASTKIVDSFWDSDINWNNNKLIFSTDTYQGLVSNYVKLVIGWKYIFMLTLLFYTKKSDIKKIFFFSYSRDYGLDVMLWRFRIYTDYGSSAFLKR